MTIFQTRGDARCIVSYTLPQCWRSFSFTRHHRPAINSPGAQRETKPKKARAVLYVSHHAITLTNQSRLHPFSTLFSKRRGAKVIVSFFLSFFLLLSLLYRYSFLAFFFPVWPTFFAPNDVGSSLTSSSNFLIKSSSSVSRTNDEADRRFVDGI